MTTTLFSDELEFLNRWCSAVPELRVAGDALWSAESRTSVSYPDSGYANLADLERTSYWFRHRNEVITSVARAHPPAGPIFDIGGGSGVVSAAFRNAGFSPVVMEPGAPGVEAAHARGLPTIHAAFQDLTIADSSIPAAGMFDVLEHIEDDRAALANLFHVLQPGGMLYLAVPTYQALWSVEDVHAGHFRRYTLKNLCERAREAGFDVLYGSYFFSALILPILVFRAFPFRLRRADSVPGNARQQHTLPDNAIGKAIGRSFAWELARVRAGRTVPVGTSCIVACRKPAL